MTTDVYIGEMPSLEKVLPGGIIQRSQLIMYAEIDIYDLGDFVYKDEPVFFRQEKEVKSKVISNCREHEVWRGEIPKAENEHYICLASFPKILRAQIIEVIEDQVNNMPADEIQKICDGFNN